MPEPRRFDVPDEEDGLPPPAPIPDDPFAVLMGDFRVGGIEGGVFFFVQRPVRPPNRAERRRIRTRRGS